jgi:hypothetical protein
MSARASNEHDADNLLRKSLTGLTFESIPEPRSSLLMLFASAVCFSLWQRRRRT